MAPRVAAGEGVGLLFGRERYGLENHEVALADRILTLPVNPAFASLNLAQAVIIVAYEWFKLSTGGALPFAMPQKSEAAPREQLLAFFANLERELEKVEFFRPAEKRETMSINLRNIFHRMAPTRQDIQTLRRHHGDCRGPQGPGQGRRARRRGGRDAARLLAEHDHGRVPNERAPVRGLARLLRRNPTDAERVLWDALTKDRRFAGRGFKRQTPIGRHITDLVSFPLRLVIDLVPDDESEVAGCARGQTRLARRARLSGDRGECERDRGGCERGARSAGVDDRAKLGSSAMFEPAIFPSEAEPALTAEFFKSDPPGFFVDIGANDPVLHSQSLVLEQRGWTGILVEPLPEKAAEVCSRRKPRCTRSHVRHPKMTGSFSRFSWGFIRRC